MSNRIAQSKRKETITALVILALLAGTAIAILFKQRSYDASIYTPAVAGPSHSERELPWRIPKTMFERLRTLNKPESFDTENLFDKINGKAELYVPAGFVRLTCQRFSEKANPQSWGEIYIYDMGEARNAFAVFSSQRRVNALAIDIGDYGYISRGALFFTHGEFYVEMISSGESATLVRLMSELGRHFVSNTSAHREDLPELRMFPPENLQPGSITLISTNVFGFSRLGNVFTARYIFDTEEATAFISLRHNSNEAKELLDAYGSFLIANGAGELQATDDIPASKLLELFGTYELVFTKGSYLVGVHEAPRIELAQKLGIMLSSALSGVEE